NDCTTTCEKANDTRMIFFVFSLILLNSFRCFIPISLLVGTYSAFCVVELVLSWDSSQFKSNQLANKLANT
ncbi:hypothetical protein BUZ72_12935, partial [Staphylococcus saprophyticus]